MIVKIFYEQILEQGHKGWYGIGKRSTDDFRGAARQAWREGLVSLSEWNFYAGGNMGNFRHYLRWPTLRNSIVNFTTQTRKETHGDNALSVFPMKFQSYHHRTKITPTLHVRRTSAY